MYHYSNFLLQKMLIRTAYRRLCDGEAFFFTKLLYCSSWRSDEEITGGFPTYREHLFTKYPDIYHDILTTQSEGTHNTKTRASEEYLDLVARLAQIDGILRSEVIELQLKAMQVNIYGNPHQTAGIHLRDDQYIAYTILTSHLGSQS